MGRMFQLPSWEPLCSNARDTLLRFPLVLFSGMVCFALSSYAIFYPSSNSEVVWRATFSAMLGIPLFFSLAAHQETAETPAFSWASPILGAGLLCAYFLSYDRDAPSIFMHRF